jgi:hypothetical protein
MTSDIFRILFLTSLVSIQVLIFILEKLNKKNNNPEFFEVEIVDNNAQWVYNNKIYYSKVINGKVDYKNIREISLK